MRNLHALFRPGDDGGLEELAAQVMRLAAGEQHRAVIERVLEVIAHLVDGRSLDQRPEIGAVRETVADTQLFDRDLQALGELVIDALLHIDPVGADAGLAVVAELALDRAFDRRIQIGVVEHDEGGVAAQLHRAFHHLIGGLPQQRSAHLGRAGEGQLAHLGVLAELLADFGGGGRGDHREHALGHAGLLGQHRHGECRKRGERGGADHEGAARRQRRGHLARDHRVGEVPRRDPGGDADRLADHGDPLVGHVAGDSLAIDALGLFAEPFDEARAIGHLATALGERLALLGGHQDRQILLMLHHQVVPAAQDLGALLAGFRGPGLLRLVGDVDRLRDLGPAQIGDRGENVAARGVGDVEGLAVLRGDPLAAEKGAVANEVGAAEQ